MRLSKIPMGGIVTGNFSVGSRGQLYDWGIFKNKQVMKGMTAGAVKS